MYRYFSTEAYRDAFLQGKVWTTTIHACRGYADDARVDSGEGTLRYTHDPIIGDAADPEVRAVAARFGVGLGRATEIQIEGCDRFVQSPDAWMLCVSRQFSPALLKKFGAYCVRIERPAALYMSLADVIRAATPLREGGYRRVHYRNRHIHHLAAEPGSAVFVKPLSYAEEAEMRFLWVPRTRDPLEPRIFDADVKAAALTPLPPLRRDGAKSSESHEAVEALTAAEARIWRAERKRQRRCARKS